MALRVFVVSCLMMYAMATEAPRLSNWMEDLMPVIGNLTMRDMAVINTHNTASADLTATVSDNCIGMTSTESAALHDLTALKLNPVGKWIQLWAKVQTLGMVDQLNAGMRMIDFRMIWTAPFDKGSTHQHDFYMNHRTESVAPAMSYLAQLKAWMDQHPMEIVSVAISRHGDDTYPNTPLSALQDFWSNMTELFSGMLLNHTAHPSSTTTISQLVSMNQRLMVRLADYQNMTGGGSDLANEPMGSHSCGTVPDFSHLTTDIATTAASCFTPSAPTTDQVTLSLHPDPDTSLYEAAAAVHFAPIFKPELVKKCANTMNFSAMSGKWCPASILEYEWLENYYVQFLLEKYLANYSQNKFPNVIHVNALGANGTIQIGNSRGYGIMDVTLLANLRAGCQQSSVDPSRCQELEVAVLDRLGQHPLQTWEDDDTGRRTSLPT